MVSILEGKNGSHRHMTNLDVEPLFPGGEVTSFQGRSKPFFIETHSSGAARNGFLDILEANSLVEAVGQLYLETFPNRDPGKSLERVRMSLSHPRTYLTLIRDGVMPVGYGIFPRFVIEDAQVLYSSRGLVGENAREGAGTHVLDLAMQYHDEDLMAQHRRLQYGVLITQNPASVVSAIRAPRTENVRPFQNFGGRYIAGSRPRRIMQDVSGEYMVNATATIHATGVIRRELLEVGPNENYRPSRDQGLLYNIWKEMTDPEPDGLDMNFVQGDLVTITYDITPRSSDAVTEVTEVV